MAARGVASQPEAGAMVTDAMLTEHEANRTREQFVTDLIVRMQSHWRRWPEFDRTCVHDNYRFFERLT